MCKKHDKNNEYAWWEKRIERCENTHLMAYYWIQYTTHHHHWEMGITWRNGWNRLFSVTEWSQEKQPQLMQVVTTTIDAWILASTYEELKIRMELKALDSKWCTNNLLANHNVLLGALIKQNDLVQASRRKDWYM